MDRQLLILSGGRRPLATLVLHLRSFDEEVLAGLARFLMFVFIWEGQGVAWVSPHGGPWAERRSDRLKAQGRGA